MFIQLVFLVFFHTALADPVLKQKPSYYDVSDYEIVGRHFEKFLKDHNKVYDDKEKAIRLKIFIDNLKEINRLNAKHPDSIFDITKFADQSKEDMQSYYGFKLQDDSNGDCKVTSGPSSKDAPAAWDWRDKGAVSPVKDQKRCGSCWAFSATAMVESRNWQAGKKVILSEQQMVDCDKTSSGCNGGLMSYALTEIMHQGGQDSEAAYPYEANNDTCRFDADKIASQVTGCSVYSITDEEVLKELLYKEGPLSIAVSASNWSSFSGGVFKDCDQHDLDHGVLLVGYGTENGVDFWIIKNSWGETFADKGFIKVQRGVNCCGIASNETMSKVSATIA